MAPSTSAGEIYHYEFEHRGHRFRGSTGCKSKREAQEFERTKRQEAAKEAERREALGRAPLTWGAAPRGIGRSTASITARRRRPWSLEWLTRHIGEATPLADVQRLADRTPCCQAAGRGRGPATVNRGVSEPLRRVLNRAKLWGEHLPPIEWRKHLLPEPRERVRELRAEEEKALFAALRADYRPIVRFALLTGCRLAECVGLTWADVDWGGRLIWINGKGGKRATIPLASTVRELLWPLQGQHSEKVFCYVVQHPMPGVRRGEATPDHLRGAQNAMGAHHRTRGAERPEFSRPSPYLCDAVIAREREPQPRPAVTQHGHR